MNIVVSTPNTISPLVFAVQRREPELLTPAKPIPHELKPLSDIDDQQGLRYKQQRLTIFPRNEPMEGRDPVKVIREAMAKALVFYYPWAGRLVEGDNKKLYVDCTGEGVVFVEADADIRLEDFGDEHLCPPFCEDLVYDIPSSHGIINQPLLLVQVTRFRCGGFAIAYSNTHAINDATGVVQFLKAISDIARGATTPSIPPIWERELLNARDTPCVTFSHPEYDDIKDDDHEIAPICRNNDDLVYRSFFFGSHEIATLRKLLPQHDLLSGCTSFELLISYIWRCRTIALQLNPDEEVRLGFAVNARSKFNPPLPSGYYGNGCAFPNVVSRVGKICGNPLSYTLELVQKVKASITEEYIRSVADFLVINGRPSLPTAKSFFVSNITRVGFAELDFGWGKPIYSGVANSGSIPVVLTFFYCVCQSQRFEWETSSNVLA